MKRSCSYCGRLHDMNVVCAKKPKRIFVKAEGKIAAFRNSGRWHDLRRMARQRDYHLCRVCFDGQYGDFSAVYRYRPSLEVHHIVPMAEDFGRRDDLGNLITLCRIHHEQAEAGEIDREYLMDLASGETDFTKR